jgi:hypothetical protein
MTLPYRPSSGRRQIPDAPTRPEQPTGPDHLSEQEHAHEDAWVKNFIARLAGLVKGIGSRE